MPFPDPQQPYCENPRFALHTSMQAETRFSLRLAYFACLVAATPSAPSGHLPQRGRHGELRNSGNYSLSLAASVNLRTASQLPREGAYNKDKTTPSARHRSKLRMPRHLPLHRGGYKVVISGCSRRGSGSGRRDIRL